MPVAQRRRIAIVGAGAGGVMLASALARPGRMQFDVTLIDSTQGRGLAYGGSDEALLNTPARAMALDPCSPDGFVSWLNTYRAREEAWTGEDFAPRRLFGDYLEARPLNSRGRGRPGPVASTTASACSRSPEASCSDQPPSCSDAARTLPASQRVEPRPGVRPCRLISRASR